jgi:hypothetical protein
MDGELNEIGFFTFLIIIDLTWLIKVFFYISILDTEGIYCAYLSVQSIAHEEVTKDCTARA